MGALTSRTNKCLLTVDGETVIGTTVRSLLDAGVSDIVVITGYQSVAMEEHLGSGITYVHNPDYDSSSILGSLDLVRDIVRDRELLFLPGDRRTTRRGIEAILDAGPDIRALFVTKDHFGSDDAKVSLRGGGLKISKDLPVGEAEYEYTAITRFTSAASHLLFEAMTDLRDGERYLMDLVVRLVGERGCSFDYRVIPPVDSIEIDSVRDLVLARRLVAQR